MSVAFKSCDGQMVAPVEKRFVSGHRFSDAVLW